MSAVIRRAATFTQVMIYKGHEKNPVFGPYPDNILKRIRMFECLNTYRQAEDKKPWKITAVSGEDLVNRLSEVNPEETLLVIPAGQSSKLDQVFTRAQTSFLMDNFFHKGGSGYLNCGSAYWSSSLRRYSDVCEEQPNTRKLIEKPSHLPLFHGISEGPLCPFPGSQYKVGFFSDAVTVNDGSEDCSIYLSGGGSFILQEPTEQTQKVAVLAKYLHSELMRLGKKKEECSKWENAVIMTSVGEGAALLSTFHPYYNPNDIDVAMYEKAFPNSGTNWVNVKEKLSPLDIRMRFVLRLLFKLEQRDFTSIP